VDPAQSPAFIARNRRPRRLQKVRGSPTMLRVLRAPPIVRGGMAWIESDEARGYSPFMRAQGVNPAVRDAHIALYEEAMERSSSLARVECEVIAVAVSRINGSDY
jgi:alkylhydroperoxidase family enzyme